MPNMASTPSAFKHSMMASTARMTSPAAILASRRMHLLCLGGVHFLGPFQIGSAAVADLLVKRHDMPALFALAEDLVVLVAPQQGRDRPEQRDHRADREPEQERAALVAADDARAQAAEEADDDIAHLGAVLEDSDRPDDRDEREYYDDHGGQRRHDPDYDLEQDPGGDQQDEDGQCPSTQISSGFTHALRVRPRYKRNGGLVGT